jgi:hemoglobin
MLHREDADRTPEPQRVLIGSPPRPPIRYFPPMPERTPTAYDLLGGDAAVQRLVDRFYDLMDTAPEAAGIRALHAKNLKVSREKLRLFLTGWLGGPQLYMERYGPPMLRARHLPFPIGAKERDEWIWCMDRALEEQEMPGMVRDFLKTRFREVADHMRNQPGQENLG